MAGFELLADHGLRIDGRRPNELRKFSCKLGVFNKPDGSASIEQGNTKVLASVYGPHQIRGNRTNVTHNAAVINCQYSMATFSTGERKRRPRGDRKSQEMTNHLNLIFESVINTELYARSQIDIFVEVLQADGGNFCACINAATLAIIDAGIDIKDFVCACSVGFIQDIPLVDASHAETSNRVDLIVALLPRKEQIVLMELTSRLHVDNLNKMLDVAIQGCKDIHQILKEAVLNYLELKFATF